MDSCSRVGLLFDDIVASVEVVNSQNVQLQCTGRVPTVAVDKTDGIQVGPGLRDFAGAAAEMQQQRMQCPQLVPSAERNGLSSGMSRLWRCLILLSGRVSVWWLRPSHCSCLRPLMWLDGIALRQIDIAHVKPVLLSAAVPVRAVA